MVSLSRQPSRPSSVSRDFERYWFAVILRVCPTGPRDLAGCSFKLCANFDHPTLGVNTSRTDRCFESKRFMAMNRTELLNFIGNVPSPWDERKAMRSGKPRWTAAAAS